MAKKYILSFIFAICGLLQSMASDPSFKVFDVNVGVNEKEENLSLNLQLNLKDFKVNRNGEAVFTPVIYSENRIDSLLLSPIRICGRNRYFYYLREGDKYLENNSVYRAGTSGKVNYSKQIPLQPWMLENATVEVIQQYSTCWSCLKSLSTSDDNGNVMVAKINREQQLSDFDLVFAPPVEDKPVEKSVEGRAFVTFVVNRTELDPRYMDNPKELQKILNSINIVREDSDAIITEIHIRGYASPEGPYDNNVRLAKGRTETLANYVNNLYNFSPGIMTTSYDPEDWGGLRSYVADSLNYKLTNRQGLLSIIDGPLGFDAKDNALKIQYPADYQVILKEIYPWLRHSDYSVKYRIKVYTELSDLLRLYNSDLEKLRPVDFYTIAAQYPIGSPQYLEVMKNAEEVYPDDPMINLNVANLYLMQGDFEAAQSCLLKAGLNPESNYARGVLAAKRGDFREAKKWLSKAREGGVIQAEKALEQLKDFQKRNRVEILIQPTK